MKYRRISTQKMNQIFFCFSEEITTLAAAAIIGVNRQTVKSYYDQLRKLIFEATLKELELEFGVDERAKFCRETQENVENDGNENSQISPVLGITKRGEKLFVRVIENCSREALLPITHGKILENSPQVAEFWKDYAGLILNGRKYYRIFHRENEFPRGKKHIDGMEYFWSLVKRRFAQFNGCSSGNFLLHLKECEWRYNHRREDLFPLIKKIFTFDTRPN